ncbi:hypothetical protein JD292_09875 [Leucobacter sp. CSA2]|uniref:Uncharacterized protein n=1 Tax=Leucobacter edaphi TaxID=2796472 RepID=A0A934QCZ5_9MICO|nr:hypothetical protein [Leucobacter edaphi]MBK0422381.1 hypothetical protein [Leucobacter edaphi]
MNTQYPTPEPEDRADPQRTTPLPELPGRQAESPDAGDATPAGTSAATAPGSGDLPVPPAAPAAPDPDPAFERSVPPVPPSAPAPPAGEPAPSPAGESAPSPASVPASTLPRADGAVPQRHRFNPRPSPIIWGVMILAFCGYLAQRRFGPSASEPEIWAIGGILSVGVLLLTIAAVVLIRNRKP